MVDLSDIQASVPDAQVALHETRAAYEKYAKTLPWSAEPMPGWEGDKQLRSSYRSHKEDSPGYTTTITCGRTSSSQAMQRGL
ncbi:hypothetical protein ACFXJ6_40330 [Streptomyces sp. NPDC059218]|uniref:hypothetical protein n=1 Tax=unclassified Streptomyces TaxID=2593676 RepID=UPI0036C9E592